MQGMSSDNRHDGTRVIPASVQTVKDLSASDYMELYALIDVSSGSPQIVGGSDSTDGGNYGTRFGAYKIIE